MIKRINICGVIYEVLWMDKPILDDGKEQWAVLDSENRELSIYNGLSEHDTKHLLCHEIAHEVFNMLGIEIDEVLVKLFVRVFFDAIDRNYIFNVQPPVSDQV